MSPVAKCGNFFKAIHWDQGLDDGNEWNTESHTRLPVVFLISPFLLKFGAGKPEKMGEKLGSKQLKAELTISRAVFFLSFTVHILKQSDSVLHQGISDKTAPQLK